MITFLCWLSVACAALPALLFLRNLREYVPAPSPVADDNPRQVSILIPARDEEATIAGAIQAAAATRGIEWEVLILDDHSSDRTAAIVQEAADRDSRVRLIPGPELPPGWCGKQHACWILAQQARFDCLVFVDADVRLAPDACARFVAFLDQSDCALGSGIPRQITGTWLERLLIPLIHFVLLGFLPIDRMRKSLDPAMGAACGQLLVVRRGAYEKTDGHRAFRGHIHDGLHLPRHFRRAGYRTDLFDATDTASCRMYHSAAQVWGGLGKNAHEALAAPRLIGPMTLLLGCGQILPWVLLIAGAGWVALLGCLVSILPRAVAAVRFQQPVLGVLMHPISMVLLLTIQWQAFIRHIRGLPSTWRGRELAQVRAASE